MIRYLSTKRFASRPQVTTILNRYKSTSTKHWYEFTINEVLDVPPNEKPIDSCHEFTTRYKDAVVNKFYANYIKDGTHGIETLKKVYQDNKTLLLCLLLLLTQASLKVNVPSPSSSAETANNIYQRIPIELNNVGTIEIDKIHETIKDSFYFPPIGVGQEEVTQMQDNASFAPNVMKTLYYLIAPIYYKGFDCITTKKDVPSEKVIEIGVLDRIFEPLLSSLNYLMRNNFLNDITIQLRDKKFIESEEYGKFKEPLSVEGLKYPMVLGENLRLYDFEKEAAITNIDDKVLDSIRTVPDLFFRLKEPTLPDKMINVLTVEVKRPSIYHSGCSKVDQMHKQVLYQIMTSFNKVGILTDGTGLTIIEIVDFDYKTKTVEYKTRTFMFNTPIITEKIAIFYGIATNLLFKFSSRMQNERSNILRFLNNSILTDEEFSKKRSDTFEKLLQIYSNSDSKDFVKVINLNEKDAKIFENALSKSEQNYYDRYHEGNQEEEFLNLRTYVVSTTSTEEIISKIIGPERFATFSNNDLTLKIELINPMVDTKVYELNDLNDWDPLQFKIEIDKQEDLKKKLEDIKRNYKSLCIAFDNVGLRVIKDLNGRIIFFGNISMKMEQKIEGNAICLDADEVSHIKDKNNTSIQASMYKKGLINVGYEENFLKINNQTYLLISDNASIDSTPHL